jgi:hypothetical protein
MEEIKLPFMEKNKLPPDFPLRLAKTQILFRDLPHLLIIMVLCTLAQRTISGVHMSRITDFVFFTALAIALVRWNSLPYKKHFQASCVSRTITRLGRAIHYCRNRQLTEQDAAISERLSSRIDFFQDQKIQLEAFYEDLKPYAQ